MEASTVKPRYMLLQPLYAGDQYIDAGTEIEFAGTPNESMECLNSAAEERMKAYLRTLEGGKTPRVEDIFYLKMRERPREDETVTLPHAVKEVPQMGNLRKDNVSDVKIINTPDTPLRTKKVLGTVVVESASLGEKGP